MPLLVRLSGFFLSVVLASCGGKATQLKVVAPNVKLGACAAPSESGVVSERPDLQSADRDLNSDSQKEIVYSDRKLCRHGNCFWNLFTHKDDCPTYIGTVAGAALEILPASSNSGFHHIRSWWKFSKTRQLLHLYRFENGGYQLTEVLTCRQVPDEQLKCAQEEQGRSNSQYSE